MNAGPRPRAHSVHRCCLFDEASMEFQSILTCCYSTTPTRLVSQCRKYRPPTAISDLLRVVDGVALKHRLPAGDLNMAEPAAFL